MMTPSDGFWKGKKVFVTGAFGFLGSWLTLELVRQKAQVVVLLLDRIPHSNLYVSGAADHVSVVQGDVSDYEAMLRIFNEYEIEYCFHLAAQPLVTVANRNPLSTFNSNIKGTWSVLEAARVAHSGGSTQLKGIVVASSDKVYGESKELPYKETFPLNASHPYDVSKACTDIIAQSYAHTYKLPLATARSGNFYGGGDTNFDRLIPGTILALSRGVSPVIRSDGTFIRDYFYVKDAVDAFLTLARNLHRPDVAGEAFNLGTENQYTVLEVVNRLIALCGSRSAGSAAIAPTILGQASNEIQAQYLDCSKAKQLLGWSSSTSFEQGLKETFKWYSEFFAGNGNFI